MKTAVVIFLIALTTFSGNSQTIDSALEHNWTGLWRGYYEGFSPPEYYVKLSLGSVVTEAEVGNFTGILTSNFDIQGIIYVQIVAVTGFLDVDNGTLSLDHFHTIRADKLPDFMEWAPINFRGELVNDSGHPGYFLIQGMDGKNDMELTNYGY